MISLLSLMLPIATKLNALWQFSRPHTVIGTTLSAIALFAIAFSQDGMNFANFPDRFPELIWAIVACLGGNVYIVGLNQLEDIEIDKINKPHLPLASGAFSIQEARIIVAITGIGAVAIATWQGVFLALTVIVSLLIGTAYSLPPIRLKRFPFWASLCIFVVRGVVINLGLFLHFDRVLNQRSDMYPNIPNEIWLLTIFVLIFTYVIAIFKDMPDTEGDAKFNIATLCINWGQKTVFNLSRQILIWLYLGTVLASSSSLITNINIPILAISHMSLAAVMWWQSLQVDLSDRAAISTFYQFIWKLFYLEYLIFPLAYILRFSSSST
ncbi:homogentisate phytyltransferase [Pseudanabaena sp. PCC 6802]|uniref:homogentisate phytyltransferase n=1 Tax=Pseudanabaena sp. PCC 6802 TaxID=118173 RepID=UPI00036FD219|nr:homogentisate phytyltransferase [Pseudanabaena sp. PCC 6802]